MQQTGDILVVDDDRPTVEFITEVLNDVGYSVRSAHDMAGCMAAIKTGHPALVLLDLTIPGDSKGLIEYLRTQQLAHIAVIIMTAHTQTVAAEVAQGVEYLSKPFDIDELLAFVARYVPPPGAQRD